MFSQACASEEEEEEKKKQPDLKGAGGFVSSTSEEELALHSTDLFYETLMFLQIIFGEVYSPVHFMSH